MTYVERLAELIVAADADTLDDVTQERLRSFLFYNLAMAMAGWSPDDVAWKAIRGLSGDGGDAQLLVTGEWRALADAAFINAAMITARGQNDTYMPAHGHIGCVVIPAVLAVAQARGATGADVLAALAAGYETQGRVGRPVGDRVVARGLRATSLFGVFGAAAGAARCLRLSAAQTADALAIAASMAGGTMQCWADGSMEWRIEVAHAARAGLTAALLAEAGVTGARHALEGPAGFYAAFAGVVPDLDEGTGAIRDVLFKPLPGCAINQAPAHALLGLDDADPRSPAEVAAIEVALSPSQHTYPGTTNRGPFDSPSGAIMSTAFMMAAAQRDRALFQRHFEEEHASVDLARWGERVSVVADPALASGSTRVTRRLSEGTKQVATCTDRDVFVFDWAGTCRIVERLVPEVAVPDAAARLGRLRDAIAVVGQRDTVDAIMAIVATGGGVQA